MFVLGAFPRDLIGRQTVVQAASTARNVDEKMKDEGWTTWLYPPLLFFFVVVIKFHSRE